MSDSVQQVTASGNTDLQIMQAGRWGVFYTLPARLLSYAIAIVLTTYLFLFPNVLADSAASINHSLLTLLLLGTSAGFIHGSGFVPRLLIWKLLFSPLFAWPALVFGLWYVLM